MEDVSFLYAELQRYKKNPAAFDDGKKEQLSRRTDTFLNEYLADEIIFETDAAPELLMLLQKRQSLTVCTKKSNRRAKNCSNN